MIIQLLKSKLHRVKVTDANIDYIGSITLDRNLMDKARLLPYEKVHIANLSNGDRFETYVIEGQPGSGEVCINGAAAHLAKPGDLIIVMSFVGLEEKEIKDFKPVTVFVDEKNHPVSTL
jgi:aspartate 1-decarboxylase